MKPKKSLGQNFLTSIPARIAIVNAGNLTSSDTVLEIGPGKGFLTKGLLETGAKVIALEKDKELLPILTKQFSSYKNFTLTEGDALLSEPPHKKYKLIANIPYYITGAILERYLSHKYQPEQMVVLIQQEVAERIVARNGKKSARGGSASGGKESILSLAVKVYGDTKIVYRVKRGSFNPIPNVDSAVLSITNISRKNFINKKHEETFFKIIKAGFAHKRKYLISNLKESFPEINWQKLFIKNNLNEKIRAEDLTLPLWLTLAK